MPLKLQQEELPTINLTSMIDVVFLLLIFFMVGTRFSDTESNISINLPKVSRTTATPATRTASVVSIAADSSVALDGQRIPLNELEPRLRNQLRTDPQLTVAIKSDAQVSMQRFIEVHQIMQQVGIKPNVVLANQPSGMR